MAKTYSRSEITPDLLKQNLQYFFNKPVRDYKRGMDEIVLSYPPNETRWFKIVDYWYTFCSNPPIVNSNLRNVVEKLAATATTENIDSVLDVFDELTSFMSTTLNKIKDDDAKKLSSEISELNIAIYDKSAQIEHEAEIKRLYEERKAEEEATEKLMERQSVEQKVLNDLQSQIAEIGKILDDLNDNSSDNKETSVKLKKILEKNGGKFMSFEDAKERITEAKENANRIADLMENEIKQKREAEELRKQEELIRRSDERDEFNYLWNQYVDKYVADGDKPTVDLFKKFLIDVKGLTPKQIDAMKVSAKIFDDGIINFIEFDEELQRVKTTITKK